MRAYYHRDYRPKVVKIVEEMKKAWVDVQKTFDSEAVQNLRAEVKAKFHASRYKGEIN